MAKVILKYRVGGVPTNLTPQIKKRGILKEVGGVPNILGDFGRDITDLYFTLLSTITYSGGQGNIMGVDGNAPHNYKPFGMSGNNVIGLANESHLHLMNQIKVTNSLPAFNVSINPQERLNQYIERVKVPLVGGKVPDIHIPSHISGNLSYKGTTSLSANPSITTIFSDIAVNTNQKVGDFYIVTDPGYVVFNSTHKPIIEGYEEKAGYPAEDLINVLDWQELEVGSDYMDALSWTADADSTTAEEALEWDDTYTEGIPNGVHLTPNSWIVFLKKDGSTYFYAIVRQDVKIASNKLKGVGKLSDFLTRGGANTRSKLNDTYSSADLITEKVLKEMAFEINLEDGGTSLVFEV